MFQLFKVFKMIRSTKKIMVSSENFDFELSAFLTADPKKHVYFYFVAVLSVQNVIFRFFG